MTTLPSGSARSVAVDADALARWATGPGPDTDQLTIAVTSLAGALAAAIPPTATRPAGGRAAAAARGPLARWAREAGAWAVEVDAHRAAVVSAGREHADLDRAAARGWSGVAW